MNIIKHEMKANRKSLLLWSIGVVFMVVVGMGKFAGLNGTGESMNELMDEMPKSLQAIMGSTGFDLTTAMGYFGLLFLYLVIMATIHAVILGADIMSKEERDKTVEFLLVKPISRTKVITSKLLAALINLLIFNLVNFVSSIIIVRIYAKGEEVVWDIALLMLAMLILQLIFLVIGAAIAAIYKEAKSATAISTGVLLITFILSIAINMSDKLEVMKYFTPFKYFEAAHILNDGGFDPVNLVISLVLIVVLTAITYHFYQKKDLNL